MWGICGQIEEETKRAAWLVFDQMRKQLLGVYLIFPSNKKQAFQHMVKNADESGWILPYQFQRSLALRSCPHLHHVALPPPNSERQSDPISALDWVQVWNNDTRTQAVDPVHHDLRGRVLPSTLQDDDRLWDRTHLLQWRARHYPAWFVPTRDNTQYACREYYGDTPYPPEEVSEASSGMEDVHDTEC